MIWLLISQGFARHVSANPEKLRHHFVDFSGKISLIVATEEIILDNPNTITTGIRIIPNNFIFHLLSCK
jgi:hypothetical protein